MKSIIMSIRPEWCELIANGKKTVEVRKTRPKLETPFKVYIYCTKTPGLLVQRHGNKFLGYSEHLLCGKVVGEFICDKVDRIAHCGTCNKDIRLTIVDKNLYVKELDYEYLNKCKLSYYDIDEYSNGCDVYGWHISNLVIYDRPRELGEFYRVCEREGDCDSSCPYLYVENTPNCYEIWCTVNGQIPIKRPPQSWCYTTDYLPEEVPT